MREVKGGLEEERAATGLLICARWPSRRQTKTEERERETSARFKWREFVRFCRDVPDDDDVDS